MGDAGPEAGTRSQDVDLVQLWIPGMPKCRQQEWWLRQKEQSRIKEAKMLEAKTSRKDARDL